jgi:uncharacterized protein (TIGR03000 family)
MIRRAFAIAVLVGCQSVVAAGPVPSSIAIAPVKAIPAFVQISPTMGPISPVMPPLNPVPGAPAMGRFRPIRPIVPFPWFPGGVLPYYGYGYPQPQIVIVPTPVPFVQGTQAPPERTVIPGNEFPATLVLEFPADVELWINGEKADEKPTNEWTLTSPVLKLGESYTFKVKAQWKAGGKTYQAERTITVPSGERSRAIVVSGTAIKE